MTLDNLPRISVHQLPIYKVEVNIPLWGKRDVKVKCVGPNSVLLLIPKQFLTLCSLTAWLHDIAEGSRTWGKFVCLPLALRVGKTLKFSDESCPINTKCSCDSGSLFVWLQIQHLTYEAGCYCRVLSYLLTLT